MAGAALWISQSDNNPVAPVKLTAKALSPTSVELSWSGQQRVDKYVVRVASDRALTTQVHTITSKSPRTTLQDLATASPGTDHYFRVDAYRDGKFASSRTGTFNLAPGHIAKPTVVTITSTGVKLRWRATTNARQYDIVVARDKNFTDFTSAVRTIGTKPEYVTESLLPHNKYFIKIRPVNGEVLGAFSAPIAVTTPPDSKTFTIGSWNVCSEKCKSYASRARIGAAYFNAQAIDIFGLQEAGGIRVGRTTNAIWSGGSQGFVRATGGAEARYIFYRPALFQQISGGHFAIGNGRYATWAKMSLKDTAQQFFYVDVHLQNGHSNDSRRARQTGAMLAAMKKLNSTHLPIIYAGDFNSGKHRSRDSPGAMMRAAGLQDSFDASRNAPVNARFNSGHSFSTKAPSSGALIDHIFVSRDFSVSAWQQLVRMSNGRYTTPMVSDHNALKSTVTLGAVGTNDLGTPTPSADIPGYELTLR